VLRYFTSSFLALLYYSYTATWPKGWYYSQISETDLIVIIYLLLDYRLSGAPDLMILKIIVTRSIASIDRDLDPDL
jgi:hypothetical protein